MKIPGRVAMAFASAVACMLASSPPGHAQLSNEGGPIEITADRGELDDVKRRAVYVGNVDVTQGVARMKADKVIISYRGREPGTAPAGAGLGSAISGLEEILAQGDVYYVTETEKMKADNGLYNAADETITLTGNVRVTNSDGVIAGQKLVIDVASGRYTMDGGADGGRVRTVIDNSDKKRIQ